MVITTGDGNKLPDPASDGAFNLTIYNADDPFVTPEIVRCTAKSGDSLTITRAQEGTTATNKTTGSTWYVELVPTAKTIQDIDDKKLDVAGGTMTGDLTIPDKIIHSGDTNTAIRFPSADTVTVETGGSERIRVDSSGNVGIGTTAPTTTLQVGGGTGANNVTFARSLSVFPAAVSFLTWLNTNNGVTLASIQSQTEGAIDSGNVIVSTASAGTNTERLRITSAGNVGIGTTSPTSRLSVSGDTELGITSNGTSLTRISGHGLLSGGSRFGSYGNLLLNANTLFTSSAKRILITNAFETNKFAIIRSVDSTTDPSLGDSGVISSGTADFVINNTGNVGIGTISPATKLDVSGSIRASTGILFGTDTASANTLSDYEEGTFSPTLEAQTTPFTSITYSSIRGGRYTKIGDTVYCTITMRTDAISGGTGIIRLTNLPFTALNDTANFTIGGGFIYDAGSFGTFAGDNPSSLSVITNTNQATLLYRATSNGVVVSLDVSDLATDAARNSFTATILYRVA
jgi:hypothetical protein